MMNRPDPGEVEQWLRRRLRNTCGAMLGPFALCWLLVAAYLTPVFDHHMAFYLSEGAMALLSLLSLLVLADRALEEHANLRRWREYRYADLRAQGLKSFANQIMLEYQLAHRPSAAQDA